MNDLAENRNLPSGSTSAKVHARPKAACATVFCNVKKEEFMKQQTKIIGALLGAALATASSVAVAESTYGYSAAGTATGLQANARVNLSVTVPKLILLRVGSATTPVDTITWASVPSWTGSPALVDGSNQPANWNGAAHTFAAPTSTTNALVVYAWHNSGANATLTFTGTPFNAGGPTLANITVADTALGTGTAIAHPGANLGTAAPANLTTNTLYSRTWTYTLGGTPASWAAGAYSGSVTYTATTL